MQKVLRELGFLRYFLLIIIALDGRIDALCLHPDAPFHSKLECLMSGCDTSFSDSHYHHHAHHDLPRMKCSKSVDLHPNIYGCWACLRFVCYPSRNHFYNKKSCKKSCTGTCTLHKFTEGTAHAHLSSQLLTYKGVALCWECSQPTVKIDIHISERPGIVPMLPPRNTTEKGATTSVVRIGDDIEHTRNTTEKFNGDVVRIGDDIKNKKPTKKKNPKFKTHTEEGTTMKIGDDIENIPAGDERRKKAYTNENDDIVKIGDIIEHYVEYKNGKKKVKDFYLDAPLHVEDRTYYWDPKYYRRQSGLKMCRFELRRNDPVLGDIYLTENTRAIALAFGCPMNNDCCQLRCCGEPIVQQSAVYLPWWGKVIIAMAIIVGLCCACFGFYKFLQSVFNLNKRKLSRDVFFIEPPPLAHNPVVRLQQQQPAESSQNTVALDDLPPTYAQLKQTEAGFDPVWTNPSLASSSQSSDEMPCSTNSTENKG